MPARIVRVPSYRLHKPNGQAVVTFGGRDRYLGKHGTPESRAEYDRLVAEWLMTGRRLMASDGPGESDLTVSEMLLAYLKHANAYYAKNSRPTFQGRPGLHIHLCICLYFGTHYTDLAWT